MEMTREVQTTFMLVQEFCQHFTKVTMRDMFAMQALNGLVGSVGNNPEVIADQAYAIADAMMSKRKERN